MASILGIRGAFSNRKSTLISKISANEDSLSPFMVDMFARGHAVEQELLKYAEEDLGFTLSPAVVIDKRRGILASLDGVNFKHGVLVECKNSKAESKLSLAREGIVWEPYRVQILTQMLVTKISLAFLYIQDDNSGKRYKVQVLPDKPLMRKITKEAKAFYKELHDVI